MNKFGIVMLYSILLFSNQIFGQFNALEKGVFSGSFESISQWYQDDNKIIVSVPQDKWATNNYLSLHYTFGKFYAGLQYEAYMPPLLGYSRKFDGSGVAHKFFSYRGDFMEITVGDFYEQFGSGLIFRAYENRQLGIDNALNGVNIRLKPSDFFSLKLVYGKQRKYFEESNGILRGLDGDLDIIKLFKIQKNIGLQIGASLLSHYELYTGADPLFPPTVNSYSGRLDFNSTRLTLSSEYVFKESDPLDLNYFWYKTGNALLLNAAYASNGLAMNLSLRRLENMDSRSERTATDTELMINFLPANTKQHKYSLANIYPYSAQVMGEIGGQYSVFYKIPTGSLLGGKYGTKLNFNYSVYYGLDTTFLGGTQGFESKYFAYGEELYYQDINFELDKKWSKAFKTVLGYMNQRYNKAQVDGGDYPIVNSDIVFFDFLVKFPKNRSIRTEIQHLSTKDDLKSWVAALIELNINPSWTIYAADMYNYGNAGEKVHYYNVGTSFVKNVHRIEISYSRQRESLMCVGGVCRQVPAFKGLTLNISSSF